MSSVFAYFIKQAHFKELKDAKSYLIRFQIVVLFISFMSCFGAFLITELKFSKLLVQFSSHWDPCGHERSSEHIANTLVQSKTIIEQRNLMCCCGGHTPEEILSVWCVCVVLISLSSSLFLKLTSPQQISSVELVIFADDTIVSLIQENDVSALCIQTGSGFWLVYWWGQNHLELIILNKVETALC